MLNQRIKIANGKVILPDEIIPKGVVVIENGKIAGISDKDIFIEDCINIDARGCYISPGFIDIHTHGAGGHDFSDGTFEAFEGGAKKHAQHGTTSLSPTITSGDMDDLIGIIRTYEKVKDKSHGGACFLGLHLEGPYFAKSQCGAQDKRYLKNPVKEEYEYLLGQTDSISRWSAAPELEGALEFGRYITGRGVLACIAHSDAVYEDVVKAYENGFKHVTHIYSGMSQVKRINLFRHAGVVESAYLIDGISVEMIADGLHLPGHLMKLIYKIKGADNAAMVTDSMRAAGMPEGESILGSLKEGQRVIVEEGVAKMPDMSAFAGSVATADKAVWNAVNLADIPLRDAVKMITSTPAKIMGVSNNKGSIIKGYNADVVVFNNDIEVQTTIVAGKIVFNQGMAEQT